jgi:hypothetical protein
VAYSSSHLKGAESELDVKTGHSVTHSPKTEEEVLRILKLNLQPKNHAETPKKESHAKTQRRKGFRVEDKSLTLSSKDD